MIWHGDTTIASTWMNSASTSVATAVARVFDLNMASMWQAPIAPDGKPPMITITFTEPIVFEKLIIVKGEGDKAGFQVRTLNTWLIRVR